MVSGTSRTACAVLLFAMALPAHGGQYRGPGAGPPIGPATPGGPAGGPPAPTTPGAGSPNTGASPVIAEEASWQLWWEFNKDPFLKARPKAEQAAVTGSDDFFVGGPRTKARLDTLAPTTVELDAHVVPALVLMLDKDRNRDIQSACLVALGKVGRDPAGGDLEALLARAIARDDQEVRETAVLALGIAGRSKALPMLGALLCNDAEGRRLAGKDDVGDRTRAFAAYALGLLAGRSDDVAVKQRVHDLLWPLLQDKELKSRDLRVAATNGLGILRCNAEGAQKLLLWRTVEDLLGWFALDLGRGDELLQAQAPVAIARLLGRGDSVLHQNVKAQFAAVLTGKQRRGNPIHQSAALALGMLVLPAEQHADDAPFARALQQHYVKGQDRLARYFSLMALGRIGGAANRAWLLDAYERSDRITNRPWVALALGLLASGAASRGAVDVPIAQLLQLELQLVPSKDAQAAHAVALGLCGHSPAVPVVMRLLREQEHDEYLAGYLCVSLALLGDPTAAPLLTNVLERSARRPFLLQQAALALGRLGDKEAPQRLLAMLEESQSVAVLSALAIGIGEIGDRRSIDALVAMAGDQELTKLARAFVAAALGGVGDKDLLPWNAFLSHDCNYAAAVDTLTNGSTGVLDIL